MDSDYRDVWQSQSTEGTTMSTDEFRRRLARARVRATRKHFIVLSIALANLAGSILVGLFSFSTYRSVLVWAVALEFVAWVVWCWYLPKDWLVLRSESPLTGPGTIQLGLSGSANACLDFYERELKGHYDTARHGRGFALASVIGGVFFAGFALWRPELTPYSSASLAVGLVLSIGGFVRYARLRREYPRALAEYEDFEAFRINSRDSL